MRDGECPHFVYQHRDGHVAQRLEGAHGSATIAGCVRGQHRDGKHASADGFTWTDLDELRGKEAEAEAAFSRVKDRLQEPHDAGVLWTLAQTYRRTGYLQALVDLREGRLQ